MSANCLCYINFLDILPNALVEYAPGPPPDCERPGHHDYVPRPLEFVASPATA